MFTEAVAAYMDVIRDRATVELNTNNVRVLETNLAGDAATGSRSATSPAPTSPSRKRGWRWPARGLPLAQGRLTASEGKLSPRDRHSSPDQLQPPPPLPPFPATADEAVRIALVNNPDLIAITRQAEAAGFDVKSVRGTRLPTVSAVASGDYVRCHRRRSAGFQSGTATSVGLQGRMPLYQGGLPAARIRQAQALEGQTLEQRVGTERAVVANTRSAFADYQAAIDAIKSNEVAVTANELALEGVRAENSVGTRTILDVLDAEQELLNSQVLLVTARRDAYVAGFQLLNAMGQAEAEDLGLDGGAALRPARQLSPRRGRLERLVGRPAARPGRDQHRHARRKQPQGRDSGVAIGNRGPWQAPGNPRWKKFSRRSNA